MTGMPARPVLCHPNPVYGYRGSGHPGQGGHFWNPSVHQAPVPGDDSNGCSLYPAAEEARVECGKDTAGRPQLPKKTQTDRQGQPTRQGEDMIKIEI